MPAPTQDEMLKLYNTSPRVRWLALEYVRCGESSHRLDAKLAMEVTRRLRVGFHRFFLDATPEHFEEFFHLITQAAQMQRDENVRFKRDRKTRRNPPPPSAN
jgi:hypothetical protein